MRKDVEDFAVLGKRDVAGGVDGAANVFAFDIARTMPEGDSTAAIDATDVSAGHADHGGLPPERWRRFRLLRRARRMELTVGSRLTIRPLRRPLDSAAPRAEKFHPFASISAINTHVLVLPISSPIRYLSFFAKLCSDTSSYLIFVLRRRGGCRSCRDSRPPAGNSASRSIRTRPAVAATGRNCPRAGDTCPRNRCDRTGW